MIQLRKKIDVANFMEVESPLPALFPWFGSSSKPVETFSSHFGVEIVYMRVAWHLLGLICPNVGSGFSVG